MLSIRRIIAVAAVLTAAGIAAAFADEPPGKSPLGTAQTQEMARQHHPSGMMPMGGHAGMHAASNTPSLPGQDAFGAIQEIVQILEADPNTDWSKVDLEALRQHLVDMNEVTLKADAAAKPIEGGVEIAVTGSNRTLVAIQRMIPAWAQTADGRNGWSTKAAPLPNGELLTVTATEPKEVQHIRGLGYIGLLVSGTYHQMHHLAMAKGEFDHAHPGHTH